jgi:hypothetical protein
VLQNHGVVRDVTVDDKLRPWAIFQASKSFGPIDLSETTEDADDSRLVVYGNTILVARVGTTKGLSIFTRSGTGAPATRKCDIEKEGLADGTSVLALATNGKRMVWSGSGTSVADLGDCNDHTVLTTDRAVGVGLDSDHVVARFDAEVRVYDASSGQQICSLPLPASEPVQNGMANTTVIVEPEVAWVLSPVGLYRVFFTGGAAP